MFNIVCWVFGHDWKFPGYRGLFNPKPITLDDYRCYRCGISKGSIPEEVEKARKVQEEINSYV